MHAPVKRYVELALRALAIAIMLALVVRVWPQADRVDGEVVQLRLSDDAVRDTSGLSAVRELLPTVTSSRAMIASSIGIHLPIVTIPSRSAREAISALSYGFATVSWTDSAKATGLAITSTSTADPQSRVVVSVAGAPGSMLVADNGGVLDSVLFDGRTANVGDSSQAGPAESVTSLMLLRTGSSLHARQNGSVATAASPQLPSVKRLLVYARPGWESKFLIAALEEAGWSVDASLPIAPRVAVTVGSPRMLDTGRYAAAIVVDSGVVTAGTISKFVREGGGVVISGDALNDRALAALASLRVTGVRNAIPGGLLSAQPTNGLELIRVAVASNAIVLQRDPASHPAITVRRLAGGRVAGAMFPESWRRRMEGSADGADSHRDYWAGLVRAVAFMSFPPTLQTHTTNANDDEAPYASLAGALGKPTSMPPRLKAGISTSSQAADSRLNAILLRVALTSLLAEWLLRRLRGAR